MAFVCAVCAKSFSQNKNLLRHQRNACKGSKTDTAPTTPSIHTCTECNKTFSSISNLLRHARSHHSSQGDNLTCATCGKMYTRTDKFREHTAKCTGPSSPCVRCLRCVWIDVCFRKNDARKKMYGALSVTVKHDHFD